MGELLIGYKIAWSSVAFSSVVSCIGDTIVHTSVFWIDLGHAADINAFKPAVVGGNAFGKAKVVEGRTVVIVEAV